MNLLKFMFSDFWKFVGCMAILSAVGTFMLHVWSRFWRHFTMMKHGYPPPHCDADGEFKKNDDDDE